LFLPRAGRRRLPHNVTHKRARRRPTSDG